MTNKFSFPNILPILGITLLGLIPSILATALWARNTARTEQQLAQRSAISQASRARLQAGHLGPALLRVKLSAPLETNKAISYVAGQIEEIQSAQKAKIANAKATEERMAELSQELTALSKSPQASTSESIEKIAQSAEEALGLADSKSWSDLGKRWDGIVSRLGGPLNANEKEALTREAESLDKEIDAAKLPSDPEGWFELKSEELNRWLTKLRKED